ncbi:MAG: hypothetical protein HQ461_10490 [Deltaproteobacteria bacterium]|nr:hypothetical protein [Deltaproteobacteria bacterium]
MRSLGLLIFVSLSVAACAEDTVASSGRSSGGGGGGGTAAENCLDGVDNDLDGSIDCADSDCGAAGACQGFSDTGVQDTGTTDTGVQDTGVQDTGSTDTGVQDTGNPDTGPQPQPENCIDGLDNDLDGRADCADSDCAAAGACQTGPEICGNNFDDDRNGVADCADSACVNIDPCIGENCFDGVDNDRDGFTDCADALCLGLNECVFYREFNIVVESVAYDTSYGWDPFGGAPDPLVQVFVNGALVLDTGYYDSLYSVSMNDSVTVYLSPSDTIGIAAYDYDSGSTNEVAFPLTTYSISAEFVGVSLTSENSIATVNWSIRYP